MNESNKSHYVIGMDTMNNRAEELIQANSLEADRMHQIELRKMSADVQVLNSRANIELNGNTSVKTLSDGSIVTTTTPNMFERMYKLRSDGKNPKERQRIKREVNAYEKEYRGDIDRLTDDDGLELCQAKLVVDYVKPSYDREFDAIQKRIEHQEELLVRGGMNKDEAVVVAKKMYRRVENRVELDAKKVLGLISGTGEFGVGMGIFSLDELNQTLAGNTKSNNSDTRNKEPINTGEDLDSDEAISPTINNEKPHQKRKVVRGLGALAVIVASKLEKRRDIAKANRDYKNLKYGSGKVKLNKPTNMTEEEFLAKENGLKEAFLDDYISAREMNIYNAAMQEKTYKEYSEQKRNDRKFNRRDKATKLAKKIVRKLS
jgi:hypothetical protein